jgi:integrase
MPRARVHLTNAAISRLPVPTLPDGMDRKHLGAAVRDYFDRDVTGFHVRVSPTGRKTFAVLLTVPDTGKRRRFTLGDFPTLNADSARALARARLAEVASGVDPQAVRESKRLAATRTVGDLAKSFLKDGKARLQPSTLYLYTGLLERHILPALRTVPTVDVDTATVSRLHVGLSDFPTTANQCVRLLSTLFRYAERLGLRPRGSNPATDVPRYRENLKERYLQPHELAVLWRTLDTAAARGIPAAPWRLRDVDPKHAKHAPPPKPGKKNLARGTVLPANPTAVAALRLLILTGARKSEILGLRWAEVDLSREALTLEGTKTGRSVRMLSADAVALLKSVPRVVGSPYVFPSPAKPLKPIRDVSRLWDAVRHAAGLEDMRLHDIRHTAASMMLQAGAPLADVGRSVGHHSTRSTQRYAHAADAGAKRAVGLLADAVRKAAATPETVVKPLQRRRKRA